MYGLQGLTQSTNKQDQAYRDLAQLENLEAKHQQDKQAEMIAAQQEAQFMDAMYQQADQMLEKDRVKLNTRIKLAQKRLGKNIAESGGSRRDFMENGGHSYLNEMYNGIVRSDEAARYKSNKENLAKIMMAQEKGLGHLLSERDINSMKAYFENEDGADITYTGMMNEIEIPPSANFEFGKEIHPYYVANHKGNMMKILANYQMEYPDREIPDIKTPEGEAKIMHYIRSRGWGGTGSKMISSGSGRGSGSGKGSGKEPENKVTYTNNLLTWNNNKGQPTVSDILNTEGGGFTERRKAAGSKMDKAMARKKSDIVAEYNGLNKDGFEWGDTLMWPIWRDLWTDVFDDKMALKDSYEVFGANKMTAAKAVLNDVEGYKMDGRTVKDYKPKGSVYAANGVRIGDTEIDDEYKGDYEVLGLQSAWKVKAANGETENDYALMVDALNSDGTINEKTTSRINEGYKGDGDGSAKPTTVIALKNEQGDIFYHEVDMNDDAMVTKLSNIMDKDNDLSETVNLQNESAERRKAAQKMSAQQRVAFETAKKETEEVFNSDPFKFETEKFYKNGSGGQVNRDELAKAFYMATEYMRNEMQDPENAQINTESVNKMIASNLFTNSVADTEEMQESLRNHDITAEELIQKWFEDANAGLESNSVQFQQNMKLAERWKQFLENY